MDKELYEVIYYASSYLRASATGQRPGGYPAISEDDQITRPLPPTRSTGDDSEGTQIQAASPAPRPMHWGNVGGRSSPSHESAAAGYELDLDSLSAGDEVVIETAHSTYRFTVDDPAIPAGRLIGGVLGNEAVDAALVAHQGTIVSSRLARKKLRAGAKAIFLIEWGNRLRRLTTSRVTRLGQGKGRPHDMVSSPSRIVGLEHVSNHQPDR